MSKQPPYDRKLSIGISPDELAVRYRAAGSEADFTTAYDGLVNEQLVVRDFHVRQRATGNAARMTLSMWEREPGESYDSEIAVSLKAGDDYAIWLWYLFVADPQPQQQKKMTEAARVFAEIAKLVGATLDRDALDRFSALQPGEKIEVETP